MPSTSSPSVPLINRYLLFTLCQVTLSILLCALVIRVADRSAGCTTPGPLARFLLGYLSNLLKIRRPDCVASGLFSGAPHRNPSTTNSTARSSISGFCHPVSACQSLAAKYQLPYQLEGSQSELNSRLMRSWSGEQSAESREPSRRSTGVEEEDEPQTALHSSTSTSKTSASKRSSSISSSDSFERTKLKKASSLVQADLNDDDDLKNGLENRLQHNDPHFTKPSRPFEFEKAVYNLNLLERNARNEQLHSKVCVLENR